MRRVFYRCLLWLLIVACGVSLVPRGSAEALLPELASEAAVLMDAETGQILFDKNAYLVMYPASITKVMTGLLALEHGNPEQELTVSTQVIAQVPRSSSHIALQPGEKLTLQDALYALAISSANDAAVAIAEKSWAMSAPVRLLSVTGTSLTDCCTEQMMLIGDTTEGKLKNAKLDHAMDSIRSRYGQSAISYGRLIKK